MSLTAKMAALGDDLVSRANYIEGLLGLHEQALARNPRMQFSAALEALESGAPNRIVDALREVGFEDRDVALMCSLKDTRIREVLMASAASMLSKYSFGTGQGRVTAEEAVQSIVSGLSLTSSGGKPITKFHGHGMFYFMGVDARTKTGLSMVKFRRMASLIISTLLGSVLRRSPMDLVTRTTRIDQPYDDEGHARQLPDMGIDSGSVGSLFNNPAILQRMDRIVRQHLKGPLAVAVWAEILKDPDMLIVNRDTIGVKQVELAEAVTAATGQEMTDKYVGRIFRDAVLPVMQRHLGALVSTRDVYRQEVQRMAKKLARRFMASLK